MQQLSTPVIGGSAARLRTEGARGRSYTWKGQRYDSVTTILSRGVPDSWGMRQWRHRQIATAAVEASATLHADVQQLGPDAVIGALMQTPWAKRRDAASMGTTIHDLAESIILGTPLPTIQPAHQGYVDGFRRFLDDWHPEYLAVEAPVFSPAQGYAGTLDAIVVLDGMPCVLDYKTGASVYPEAGLQLAAYAMADFLGLPDGTEHELPVCDGLRVLHLHGEGHYRLVDAGDIDDCYAQFLQVKAIAAWLAQHDQPLSVWK